MKLTVNGKAAEVAAGYVGTREISRAVETGEVQGICGLGWSTVRVQYPDVLAGKSFARVFSQEDIKGHAQLNAANVPMIAFSTDATTVRNEFEVSDRHGRKLAEDQIAAVVKALR